MHKKLRIDYEKIARFLSVVVLLLTITVAILFGLLGERTPTEAATDWYNQNWSYRQKISVDYTKVSNTDQTDFPVLLDLSDLSSGFFTNVQTDGGDIVVTAADGVTKLQRELVSINTGGSTGELWFKAPSLSSSTNTDFWIYYGNATANEGNSTAVWSNGYELVQHMNEDPSGSAPQLIDSTLNDNDGTSNGTMVTGDLVTGKVGNALNFDGTDDYFDLGNGSSLELSLPMTISSWVNVDSLAADNYILSNDDNSSTYYG
ncbi:DUF2341 domain-containing protein, partial [Candidatus Dojkabacteria bacterium]|nr:DUF2341 domain-containing protein [Candidatus Dojkabacteria bacterium]